MRILFASAILSVTLATAAHATIVIKPGNPGDIGENVLFNNVPGGNGSGSTEIRGRTNQTNTIVLFQGNEALVTTGQGQDGVDAVDGTFTSLRVDLESTTKYFTNAVFAVKGTGSLTITAFDDTPNNEPPFYQGVFNLGPGNGQNFFNLSTTGGQLIDYFNLSGTITDFGQVRLGGFTDKPGAIVPGPIAGAGLPALLALGGFVWARRRKVGSTQA